MALAFVKMQGLGNDFIVVDRREAGVPLPPAECIALCDRHRGIGADGVLAVLPSDSAPLAMHVTNSDGSIAEMCGNGLRCVARYAVDRGLLPAAGGVIDTGRGLLECHVEPDGEIRVDMGAPVLIPERIPAQYPGQWAVEVPLELANERLIITAVSMGNPHAVAFVPEGQDVREWAVRLGPAVERHHAFPNRTNAEFARFTGPRAIELVVWERGAGLTQACGTGACATVVAAILNGLARVEETIRVFLPGGALRVRVETSFARVWMMGPAVEVYRGEIPA